MYLTRLHDRGMVAPSMVALDDNTPIEGAFVIEPMKGFYSDVFVLDFKSLYPSIIMTFNIDPFTISKAGPIVAPNQASFLRQTGILPELIKKLYVERDLAKEAKDKNKSYALKITMNSFYGAMASPRSRYYSKSVGEAITSFGREIIKKAKQFIETKDYDVIYGDTDSIFVHVNRKFESLEEKKFWKGA